MILTDQDHQIPIYLDRLQELRKCVMIGVAAEDSLKALGISYQAPADAAHTQNLDNSVDLNRLRVSEYLKLAKSADLEIMNFDFRVDQKSLAALPSIPIAAEFRSCTPEQICSTSVGIALRKPSLNKSELAVG